MLYDLEMYTVIWTKNESMLFQILVLHIKTILPGLKSRISSQLTAIAKEHAFYGDPVESKVWCELILFGQSYKKHNIVFCEIICIKIILVWLG
jgi:hypothetical protein